jgi:hypothetical protein
MITEESMFDKILLASMLGGSLLAAACSDDEKTVARNPNVDTLALWAQYCQDEAEHDARCFGDTIDVQECLDNTACINRFLRPDVVEPLTRCLRERECDVIDDSCFMEAAQPHQSAPDVRTYETACLARWMECAVPPMPPFTDDLCTNTGIMLPSLRSELTQCLDLPCDQIGDCQAAATAADECKK